MITLGEVSHHVRCPVTLRVSCCKKPKPRGKTLKKETPRAKKDREAKEHRGTSRARDKAILEVGPSANFVKKNTSFSRSLYYLFSLFTIVGILNQYKLRKSSIFCWNNFLYNTAFLIRGWIVSKKYPSVSSEMFAKCK